MRGIREVGLDVGLTNGDEFEVELLNVPVKGGVSADNITGETIKLLHLQQWVQEEVEKQSGYVDGEVDDIRVLYAVD